MPSTSRSIGARFRVLAAATAICTFLLIVVGAIVRVSGSGLGCPDWPLCHGQIIPPLEFHTLVEYSHRLVTLLVTLGVVATAAVAAWKYRARALIFRASLLGVILLFLQAALGAIVVKLELPPTFVAIHLGNAMLLFAVVLIVATLANRSPSPVTHARRSAIIERVSVIVRQPSPQAERGRMLLLKLVVTSALGIFILMLSGSIVAGSGAASACTSWPLCNSELLPAGTLPFIHMLHRFIAGAVGLLALFTFYRATKSGDQAISITALFGAVALLAQIFVGAVNVWTEFPALLDGLHVALAAAVWGALVVLAWLVGLPRAAAANAELPRASGRQYGGILTG